MKLYPVTTNEFRAAWLGYTECDQPRPFSFRLLEMAAGWIVLASYAGQDHCLSDDKGRHRNMPLSEAMRELTFITCGKQFNVHFTPKIDWSLWEKESDNN